MVEIRFMLADLTVESFEPIAGTSFSMLEGTDKIELRLERVARVMESESARLKRVAFSLFFRGPVYLEQRIYRLTHHAFAEPLDLFLVPIGREADAFLYEAVFT